MAFLRNVSSLSFGSFLAIIFVTYTLIVIGLHCKVLDAGTATCARVGRPFDSNRQVEEEGGDSARWP